MESHTSGLRTEGSVHWKMDYADLSPQNAQFILHTRHHGIIPTQKYVKSMSYFA